MKFIVIGVFLSFVGLCMGVACPSEGQHFYPHPTLCRKFVECNSGNQVEHDCFGDLIFNPDLKQCDFKENYACEDVVEPELPDEGPVGRCPALNGATVTCLKDAKNCGIFYMCNWGSPIRMLCPDGLYFNSNLNVCDWPQNVDCTL